MPAGHPELQKLEHADQNDGNCRGEQPMSRVSQTERQSDQDKCQRVFTVLAKIGMRSKPRRTERCEDDGCGQKPGDNP